MTLELEPDTLELLRQAFEGTVCCLCGGPGQALRLRQFFCRDCLTRRPALQVPRARHPEACRRRKGFRGVKEC